MQMKNPSVESVTDGLAKLIRDVRLLQSEVRQLRSDLGGFTNDKRLLPYIHTLPPQAGGSDRAKAETDEPQSGIRKISYEYGDVSNLEIPTRTLIAIAKEIDGALRDIRSARNDISAIEKDSDLRDEFRDWLSKG
ncbi:hypothetical protein R2G56_06055 [Nitratireductor aquimarinus]|uniref:Uncharacterized protein n=1 Tax=Nitratireductor aquimarinus TaxID=889300 RepID=A0ABU4AHX0_9HYPH|nr:hypothetical protein [Nitratireductor aquimarinus]MDV6225843.1 hypothetical protein [Nitratireductor aquimarinus]